MVQPEPCEESRRSAPSIYPGFECCSLVAKHASLTVSGDKKPWLPDRPARSLGSESVEPKALAQSEAKGSIPPRSRTKTKWLPISQMENCWAAGKNQRDWLKPPPRSLAEAARKNKKNRGKKTKKDISRLLFEDRLLGSSLFARGPCDSTWLTLGLESQNLFV